MTETQTFASDSLELVQERGSATHGVACVTIGHNEGPIIDQFLDHYRKLGVTSFFVVDDRSSDDMRMRLSEQSDVAIFAPRNGAQFKDHVGIWRQQILDHYCDDQWVTLPDIDEFLVYKQADMPLPALADQLDRNGDEAMLAAMVDMYADKPMSEQCFSGTGTLVDEFPYFDGPSSGCTGIRIVAQPRRFVERFPTPPVALVGGVRERLYFRNRELTGFEKWLLRRYAHGGRPLNPGLLQRFQNQIVRNVTKSAFTKTPFVLNKFALLKWRRGLKFSRAPHSVDQKLQLSERLAALLHYKFYKGVSGFEYNAARGQHAGNAEHYRKILNNQGQLDANPMCAASRRFTGVASLDGIIR